MVAEKASLRSVEVLGSPGHLEGREKQFSCPGHLSKWWGPRRGLRGLSASPSLKAGMQGQGQGCVWMQVRQAAMWSGIFPTQLWELVDPGVHHAANTCQCNLEQVLICNWHPATLLSFQSPGTGTALPHSLPRTTTTAGAALLLARGLLILSEKGHREGQLCGCQAQEGSACRLPLVHPAPPQECAEQAWELKS